MHYQYRVQNVCSKAVDFDLEDGKVYNLSFWGGCDGNLRAIGKLVDGMPAEEVITKLAGNTCNGRPTSCADQLTRVLAKALESEGAAPAAAAAVAEGRA
ncbi:MAG: TIGR03905 family TSCPD domain-containing protein [Eggerthellaceae bacterium]|nr:TIGR03905 family TSCPD domain-containing protein [Eggerthellaceae bacterium]